MAKIPGQLKNAQFHNLSADPANLPGGLVWWNTSSQRVKFSADGTVKTVVTENDAQTLTNKTITSPEGIVAADIGVTPPAGMTSTDLQDMATEVKNLLDNKVNNATYDNHVNNISNPHQVTKTQVGLGNVSNLAPADMPISTATQTALNEKLPITTHNTHTAASTAHGVTGAIVGTSDSQVLTNKDIDGGTASNTNRLTLPKAAKTVLDTLTPKEATLVYDTTGKKLYYHDGSLLKQVGTGSGSGGINYITAADAEDDITGWITFNELASVSPGGYPGSIPNHPYNTGDRVIFRNTGGETHNFGGYAHPTQAVTFTNASPTTITCPDGVIVTEGTIIWFVNMGGTMPTGLSANTFYYARNVTATTFQVSSTPSGALLGTTSTGSGTIRFTYGLTAGHEYIVEKIDANSFHLKFTNGNYFTAGSSYSGTGVGQYEPARPVLTASAGTAALTWTRSTSSPLRGTASFRLTKPASNCRWQGVSFLYSHPGKVETNEIKCEYKVVSGTYATGDIRVYAIDLTTGALLEPVNTQLANVGLTSDHVARFQTTNGSTSYRFVILVNTTSTSAYTIDFDNVSVGPQITTQGAFSAYLGEKTTTGTWTTNTTYTGKYWRTAEGWLVGSVKVTTSGVPGGSSILMLNLPAGLSVDESRTTGTGAGISHADGSGKTWNGGGQVHQIFPLHGGTTQIRVGYESTAVAQAAYVAHNAPFTFAAGAMVEITYRVPILGWDSSQVLSSDVSGREISFSIHKPSNQTITATTYAAAEKVTFASPVVDTLGAWNASLNRYEFKESGRFKVSGQLSTVGLTTELGIIALIRVTGVDKLQPYNAKTASTNAFSLMIPFNVTVDVKVGEYLEIFAYSSFGGSVTLVGSTNLDANVLNIDKVQGGSQQIAQDASVAVRYSTAAGQQMTTGSFVRIDFGTKEKDSHGAITTGVSTWKFTAPQAGEYSIAPTIYPNITSAVAINHVLRVQTSTGVIKVLQDTTLRAASAHEATTVSGYTTVSLLQGESIWVEYYQGSGVNYNLITSANYNFVCINRVGN